MRGADSSRATLTPKWSRDVGAVFLETSCMMAATSAKVSERGPERCTSTLLASWSSRPRSRRGLRRACSRDSCARFPPSASPLPNKNPPPPLRKTPSRSGTATAIGPGHEISRVSEATAWKRILSHAAKVSSASVRGAVISAMRSFSKCTMASAWRAMPCMASCACWDRRRPSN